jgi:hypothetical protein
MFTSSNSDRVLARVVAGLAIAATFMLGAVAHTVYMSQPFV